MTDKPIRIFLDTDIGPDCDDTAALAILLQLRKEGLCELIGATHCTGTPYGLATIDSICRLFGVEVPLGTCMDKEFLNNDRAIIYTKPIHDTYPHSWPADKPQPDCVQTLIDVLEKEEDGSVTLVAIGPLNNVARFLRDPVAGKLMRSKVSRLVLMAGAFEMAALGAPDHIEWNIEMDVPSARIVASEWEGEILWAPFEAMLQVNAGESLRGKDNPVAMAYRIFTEGGMLRPTWDLECVVAAVRGAEGPYSLSVPGTVTMDEKGMTTFTPDENGKHRYLRLTGTNEEAAAYLEAMLARAVATMDERKDA